MGKKSRVNLKLGQVCIGVREPKCRRIPHSPNKKMHWAEQAKWKSAWEEEVAYAWLAVKNNYSQQWKSMPYKRSLLQIFVFSIKPQDEDNSYASMKGIIDGLKKIGLIVDDDPAHLHIKLINVPVKTRDAEHIELSLEMKQ